MAKYDAIVIGSGQAGNPLSPKLADHGWSVALIEKEQLGGTCVNAGCTPICWSRGPFTSTRPWPKGSRP
jgi:pyruvate/2-oxoglutarate dehydrogenase complex dihydrolipoamide dehydrogenase (E3) component